MAYRRFAALRRRALLSAAALLAAACTSLAPVEDDAPVWLRTLIRQMEQEPVANPPAYIARYEYRGGEVYYVPPRFADIPSRLYDVEGNLLCAPDGGITGRGDGRCPDFFEQRSQERIIWQDPRGDA